MPIYDDLLPKFLILSPFFITSMSCLTKSDGKIRLAILYQAKTYRKNITHEIKGREPRTNYFILKFKSRLYKGYSIFPGLQKAKSLCGVFTSADYTRTDMVITI